MLAYYNEINDYCCRWLRNLSNAHEIVQGEVDSRSIVQVGQVPSARQHHFFAGIGGWSLALKLAEWPEEVPVWTGSCPCQPFSQAGKKGGFDDARHLWPEWFRLIKQHKPPIIFGEQVASQAGLAWFDLVSTDLENEGYAVGASDLCAASVGAPHIRQRLYFFAVRVANNNNNKRRALFRSIELSEDGNAPHGSDVDGCGSSSGLDDTESMAGSQRLGEVDESSSSSSEREVWPKRFRSFPCSANGALFWDTNEWIECQDGFTRPVESGTFPLVERFPERMEQIRAYGNVIVPQVAAEFVKTVMEIVL